MLILRNAQVQAIADAAAEERRGRLTRHLQAAYPERCAELGERRLAHLVRLGVSRAIRHGMRRESDLELHLELMIEFGKDFDRSPDVPWARAVLGSALPLEQKLAVLGERATAARLARLTG